ncbi:MAG: hypothetical protein D6715_13705, partial [Calditrichaeota bacterium]
SISRTGDRYLISLNLLEVDKNRTLLTAREESAGLDGIPSAIDRLAEKTRRGLQESLVEIRASQRQVAQVTTASLEAYQHYFLGEQLLNRLKIAEAEQEYRQAIALDSTFGLAYYRLAYARSWQLGEEHLGREPLRKALALLDRIPEKERFLVRAEQARIEKGLEAYFRVLKEMEQHYPEEKEMLFNLGDYYLHTNQPEKAVVYFERVVNRDPTHGRALEHLARVYSDLHQYEKALAFARQFLSVTNSQSAYFQLADLYQKTGNPEGGIQTLLQARVAYPQNPHINLSLAALYTDLERYRQAEEELLRLRESPDSEARFWGAWGLAFFYPYLGKYRAADQACKQVIQYHWQQRDTTAAAIMLLYQALLKVWGKGDISAAWQIAQRTRPFQPRIASYAYWLGWALLAMYRQDYATAEKVIQAHRGQLSWLSPHLNAFQGECEQAQAEMEKRSSEIPEYVRIAMLFHLARCLYKKGELAAAERALLALQKIQDHSGGFRAAFYPRSIYWLGRIFERRGEVQRARETYQKFLELWHSADEELPLLQEVRGRWKKLQGLAEEIPMSFGLRSR